MIRRILHTIRARGLIEPGARVLACVSGGADSVAMLHVLRHLRRLLAFELSVAHFHHHIRGPAADEDAVFVRHLAWRFGLPFYLGEANVPRQAKQNGVSLEMAARAARYAFFFDCIKAHGLSALATAHTADDQAETILLKLARGAGPQGLDGIACRSQREGVNMIRPLLDVSHKDAVRFLKRHRLTWREDASNRDLDMLRNRVRHVVLPLLEKELNPAIRQTLVRTAQILTAENEWMERRAYAALADCMDSSERLLWRRLAEQPEALRRRVWILWLGKRGVDPAAIDFTLIERLESEARQKGTGWTPVCGDCVVRRQYQVLTVERRIERAHRRFRIKLRIPGATDLPDLGLTITAGRTRGFDRRRNAGVGKWPAEAWLSAAQLGRAPLYIRSWHAGDVFHPLGMQGRKKVQDIFTDQKVARVERDAIPLLECRGRIVWIPGYAIDREWAVIDASADSIHLNISPLPNSEFVPS